MHAHKVHVRHLLRRAPFQIFGGLGIALTTASFDEEEQGEQKDNTTNGNYECVSRCLNNMMV